MNSDLKNLTAGEKKRLTEYMEKIQNGEKVDRFVIKHPKDKEDAKHWDYKFWKTQPVMGLEDYPIQSKQLQTLVVPDEPYKLPENFEWKEINLNNDEDMDQVCELLQKYYLEDVHEKFRLLYSKSHLRWALGTTGFFIGVMIKDKNTLCGVVSGKPIKIQVHDKETDSGDVNFLCVHPKFREKGLAKVLIKEITRRFSINGLQSGFFTTEKYVLSPVGEASYYHRPINYLKLHKTNFTSLQDDVTLDEAIQAFRILYKPDSNYKLLNDSQYEEAHNLYCTYVEKYNLYQKYSYDEFLETYKNSSLVSTYGIFDEGKMVDFASYYKLPYYVVASETKVDIPKQINAGYLLMYTSNETTQLNIFRNLVALASNENLDVFNATNIMENDIVLFDPNNKFVTGSGKLYYNLYNWECPLMNSAQICKITI
jgi:glycylpeptide N-tetradecanoyltransferase